jgi:hypothetical protein
MTPRPLSPTDIDGEPTKVKTIPKGKTANYGHWAMDEGVSLEALVSSVIFVL